GPPTASPSSTPPGGGQRRAVPRPARRQARAVDRDGGRVDALPPDALARRQVAALRVEARRCAATLRDAAGRPEGAARHRPQEGARRHVVLLAAPPRAGTRGRVTNALSQNLIAWRPFPR